MTVRPGPTQLRQQFRSLIAGRDLVVMPGGVSPLHAVMAERAGFPCFFLAGSQLSWFVFGVPDSGIIGLRDVADHARHIAARAGIPILVDADTGYGNAVNAAFAVDELIRAGVAGLSIEDQEAPKKSGTSAGRRCIPVDEAVGKIQAAVAARDAMDPTFVVCARTDAIGSEGETFDDALQRCDAYAREGGADLVWLNSVESRDQLQRACVELPVPVLTIWGGPAPRPTLDELAALGTRVALFPAVASTVGAQATWDLLHDFKARGDVALDEFADKAQSGRWGRAPFTDLVNTKRIREIEEQYLPSDQRRDYEQTYGHRPSDEWGTAGS
jgi:2-methylisocitrate lyase-like PEP mutase family enzyme